jgi:hypothetical protein
MIPEPGSFRDPTNRVFYHDGEVFRGLSAEGAAQWRELSQSGFFRKLVKDGAVVGTELETRDAITAQAADWSAVLCHERIPFVSYYYEWTFGMLRDAALLHLDILAAALENGWTLKDGSAFNVQWRGHKPVFIDVSSFEPYRDGDAWFGYRQFCMMFLIPLLLKAYRDIDIGPLCRSELEGIDPEAALKLISKRDVFRRGIFTHLYLHARLQARARRAEAKMADVSRPSKSPIRQTRITNLHMVRSIRSMVARLARKGGDTVWSAYETTHSYDDGSLAEKKSFVETHVHGGRWSLVYDLGSNTGTFAQLCRAHADCVIAVDQDELAVDTLYHRLGAEPAGNITPLVMPLGNVSPNQGWRGRERTSFDSRGKPELILCLALIHHLVISANIPLPQVLQWLRSFGATVVLEFVGPEDEMTLRLLRNKRITHSDYTFARFEAESLKLFEIAGQAPLKQGKRRIYLLRPKPNATGPQAAA